VHPRLRLTGVTADRRPLRVPRSRRRRPSTGVGQEWLLRVGISRSPSRSRCPLQRVPHPEAAIPQS
jgi:hypothetical protein